MRIAYLDCFAGISGDMFLGALLEAGVPAQVLHDAAAALKLNATLKIETVDRSGISCTKVHVLEGEHLAESVDSYQHQEPTHTNSHQVKTQHLHKNGHPHAHNPPPEATSPEVIHSHSHTHVRSLSTIIKLIDHSGLGENIKSTASTIFTFLGYSEAKIHNVPA